MKSSDGPQDTKSFKPTIVFQFKHLLLRGRFPAIVSSPNMKHMMQVFSAQITAGDGFQEKNIFIVTTRTLFGGPVFL